MYHARCVEPSFKKVIIIKEFTNLSRSEQERIKAFLRCDEGSCNGHVTVAMGTKRQAHFKHKKNNIFGDCTKNRKRHYKKKKPSDIKKIALEKRILEILIPKKPRKPNGVTRPTISGEPVPGKPHVPIIKGGSEKVMVDNKISTNLKDLLEFLLSDTFKSMSSKALDDTYVVIKDEIDKFNKMIININYKECLKELSRENHKVRIYWGKIYDYCCKDHENYKHEIKDVLIEGPDNYSLILNFGNMNQKLPNAYLDKSKLVKFASELSKFQTKDVKDASIAILSDEIKTPFNDCAKISIKDEGVSDFVIHE